MIRIIVVSDKLQIFEKQIIYAELSQAGIQYEVASQLESSASTVAKDSTQCRHLTSYIRTGIVEVCIYNFTCFETLGSTLPIVKLKPHVFVLSWRITKVVLVCIHYKSYA